MKLPDLGTNIFFDRLSIFFGSLCAVLSLLVFVYSLKYIKNRRTTYYFLLGVMTMGSFGVVFSGNLINYYLFWEVLTLSIFFLVIYNRKPEHFRAGFIYLMMNLIGGFLILFAVGLIWKKSGGFEIAGGQSPCVLLLLLFGHLIKAGAFPVHLWLPQAHPAAPSPVSALLSGMTIKLGVYGIVRFVYPFFVDAGFVRQVVLASAVASMLFGVFLALKQMEIKKLLAWHSVSQMGYILLGLGLGTELGLSAGLYHTFAHGFFKALLFMSAGAVIFSTGKRELDLLGGLARRMPYFFGFAMVGSLSISGIPPFCGFISKNLLARAADDFLILKAAIFLTSACTIASFIKFMSIFFGRHKGEHLPRESPFLCLLPAGILSIGCLLLGMLPLTVLLPKGIAFSPWSVLLGSFRSFSLFKETGLGLISGIIIYYLGKKTKWFSFCTFLPNAESIYSFLVRQVERFCQDLMKIHNRTIGVHLFWCLLFLSVISLLSLVFLYFAKKI